MRPGLSTVILFFNKPSLTNRCIAAVERAQAACEQANFSDPRLILVDNGSTPDCVAEVTKNTTALLTQLAPNQGFARGMNQGLRAAFTDTKTDWAITLSNDVELDVSFYSQLSAGERPKEPVIFCPHVYYLMDRTKPSYTHGTLDVAQAQLSHHFEPPCDSIVFPNYYPAAITVWSRQAFERLGGFNERYFCYWEDVELSHRASRLGVKLTCRSDLRAYHLGRGTTGKKPSYNAHFQEGRRLTMEILAQSGY